MQTTTGTPLNATPDQHEEPTAPQPHRPAPKLIALLVGVAAVGYVTDQLTKAWASSALKPDQPREVVGTLLQLRLIRNPGAAFSIATNATWLLSVIAVAVICATVYFARRLRSKPWACALGLLIGGALGNLTDRFFRTPGGGSGHVVDFLELPHWPIFNVADICVTTAACLIALLALLGIGVDGTRSRDFVDDEDTADDGASGDATGSDVAGSDATDRTDADARPVGAHGTDDGHADSHADAVDADGAMPRPEKAAAADRHTGVDGSA